MNKICIKRSMLLCIFIIVSACAFQDTKVEVNKNAEKSAGIGSKTTSSSGKGVPYGRSDTTAEYMRLTKISTDPEYGTTKEKPINVGTGNIREGSYAEMAYLNALRGPNGEVIDYERLGSCCNFKTPNGLMGGGLLDVFIIYFIEDSGKQSTILKPVTLYLNMYDPGSMDAPKGFTIRAEP